MHVFEFQADLSENAEWYVYEYFHVPNSHANSNCQSYQFALALRYLQPHNGDELLEFFTKEVHMYYAERLWLIIETIIHQNSLRARISDKT